MNQRGFQRARDCGIKEVGMMSNGYLQYEKSGVITQQSIDNWLEIADS